jgi:DNA-binding transcriptional LysR family regulator
MKVTIRQLSVFEAAARLGGLTKAANALSMTQSAASQSLKELESTLGYSLFNRMGRELVINDDGYNLMPKVMQALAALKEIEEPDTGEIEGRLHVAASVTIASYLMPKLFAGFIAQYPGVEPELDIGNTEEVLSILEKGQAHLGLIEGPGCDAHLNIQPWMTDHLVMFCHCDHPLAKKGSIKNEEIAHQRWVLREQGSGTRNVFVTALQSQGIHLVQTLSLTRQEAIKQSVRVGLGIGCLSSMSITEELKSGVFVNLNSTLNLTRQFSLVEAPIYKNSRVVTAFVQYLHEFTSIGGY